MTPPPSVQAINAAKKADAAKLASSGNLAVAAAAAGSSSSSGNTAYALYLGPSIVRNADGSVVSSSPGKLLYSKGTLGAGVISSKFGIGGIANSTTSATVAAPSSSSLSSGALAGVVVGVVAILCVLGLVAVRRNPSIIRSITGNRRRGVKGTSVAPYTKSSSKGGMTPSGSIGGVPVWEMGQWRVMRAEDWATLEEAAVIAATSNPTPEYYRDEPIPSADNSAAPTTDIPSSHRSSKKVVSFSDQMDVVITPNHESAEGKPNVSKMVSSFFSTHKAQRTAMPLSTEVIEEEEEDTLDEEDSACEDGDDVRGQAEDGEDDSNRTISFSYSLLSQLASADDTASEIHNS
ncbi:hypothetical protein DFJ73DRAFT_865661 [Zopfochytrium polystomum]|nr:hypothetical protein DFJ73DRAFT_865661 [Zopfochytrium polystomum]